MLWLPQAFDIHLKKSLHTANDCAEDFSICDILYYLFNTIEINEGELCIALVDGKDALDIDRGPGKHRRVNLCIGETGVAARADLDGLAAHIEVLADGICRRVLQQGGLEFRIRNLSGIISGIGIIELSGIQVADETLLGHRPGRYAPRRIRDRLVVLACAGKEYPVGRGLLVLVGVYVDQAEDLVGVGQAVKLDIAADAPVFRTECQL